MGIKSEGELLNFLEEFKKEISLVANKYDVYFDGDISATIIEEDEEGNEIEQQIVFTEEELN